ncbi:MAG: helix-turn-helix transcriptional regulator [Bacteroidetes bacterium]|nr:helix-turn-helix transcriptional regulator [Bacteroidota bacterium]
MLNPLDIIILLGAIQGFIISALLYFKKEKLYANKLLAALLLLISLACLNLYLLNIQITKDSTFWSIFSLIVPMVIAMPIGPLIYFYVQSLQSPVFKLNRSHRIHFYSVIIDLLPGFIGIVFVLGAMLHWIDKSDFNRWGNFLDSYNTYADFPRWLSASIYIAFAWKKLNDFKQPEAAVWPKQFVIGLGIFQLIWVVHLIPYLIPSLSDALLEWVGWYPIYIPLAVMVYWLGFNGYLKVRPQSTRTIDPVTANKTLKVLQKVMQQDRIYLNPELTLNDVVKVTGIPQKTISAVLNQHAGKSFNEFVNEYRVEEVKRRLSGSYPEHLTITGIAFECGFNSQATFQRTFKQFTGVSPTEFMTQQSLKTA